MAKPLLIMDVDGVLAPLRDYCEPPDGALQVEPLVWVRAEIPGWVARLRERFDVVWGTTWERDELALLAAAIGMQGCAWIDVVRRARAERDTPKLEAVREYVGERAVVWMDDDLGSRAFRWAKRRAQPTLLVKPVRTEGLSERDVEDALAFAAALERAPAIA